MSLPRFRLRTLMIAVAVAAVLCAGLEIRRRRQHYETIVLWHRLHCLSGLHSGDPSPAQILWHEAMRHKYERAARYPWLPVPVDPPPPE